MRNLFIYLLLLSSILGFGQSVDGVKAKKIDGIELVSPQSTFDYAERVSQDEGSVEQLDCVYDALNRVHDSVGFMMTPSGYKPTVLYNQIPTSNEFGNETDFLVDRASVGTRLNELNLIEEMADDVPRIDYSDAIFTETEPESINLALHSEDFSDVVWTKEQSNTAFIPVVTPNDAIAPDGTMTADTVVFDLNGDTTEVLLSWLAQPVSSMEGGTASVWVRTESGNTNLSIGFSNISSSINISETWQRISITTGITVDEMIIGINKFPSADDITTVYIWGGQTSPTDELTRYVKTTTAIDGVPPLYDMEGCGVLLTEPQSTNLALRSQELDNASWTKTASSVTANNIISPDGTLNADKLIEDSSNGVHRISFTPFLTNPEDYTLSVYVKKAERTKVALKYVSGTYAQVIFDLETGVIFSQQGGNLISTNIESVGSEWFKCFMTFTTAFGSQPIYIELSNPTESYQGDGTSGLYIWGAQLEQSSVSSSYIKTEGSTVTRLADAITNGGTVNDFNSEEGVLFVEIAALEYPNSSNNWLGISDGSIEDYITLSLENTGNVVARCTENNNTTALVYSIDYSEVLKIAFLWKLNRFELWINGVKVNETLIGGVPDSGILNQLNLTYPNGSSLPFYGKTKQIKVYSSIADAQKDLPYITN